MWGLWTRDKWFWHFGFEYPFSTEIAGLCTAFCVPDCSPGGLGAAGPGSVGNMDLGEGVDLAFGLECPYPKTKGKRRKETEKETPGFLSPVHCGVAAISWKVALDSSDCSGTEGSKQLALGLEGDGRGSAGQTCA